jgi:molecular chaperone Hsp33
VPDKIYRGISADKHIRFFAVDAGVTVQTAVDIHYLSILSSVALGRLLISGLLMGATLKNPDDLLTIRVDGDGPLGTLLVSVTGRGTIKGYVQYPQTELAKSDKGIPVAEGIGRGTLSVIKSMKDQPPYSSQIDLATSEIGEDISYYYLQSEQIETMLNLGILISPEAQILQAGGVLIQCMPETPVEIKNTIIQNAERFPNLSDFMDMGHSICDIVQKHIFQDIPIEILQESAVSYFCGCHIQRFYDGIKLLGNAEIQSLIGSEESITAQCHFCDKKYTFSKEELQSMIS